MVHTVVTHDDCKDSRKPVERPKQPTDISQVVKQSVGSAFHFDLIATASENDRAGNCVHIVFDVC